jgi:hypothetical protein
MEVNVEHEIIVGFTFRSTMLILLCSLLGAYNSSGEWGSAGSLDSSSEVSTNRWGQCLSLAAAIIRASGKGGKRIQCSSQSGYETTGPYH